MKTKNYFMIIWTSNENYTIELWCSNDLTHYRFSLYPKKEIDQLTFEIEKPFAIIYEKTIFNSLNFLKKREEK